MIYLLVALQCEAKSLIETWELKRDNTVKHWVIYGKSDLKLIITGIGKVSAAMAVEYLINSTPEEMPDRRLALNFGMCGAANNRQFSVGDMIMVNKAVDHSSGRYYYPDMMVKHNFIEAAIETFDVPVTDSSMAKQPLVDMECSGFFQAASRYFSLERIACLKIVSDHLDIINVTPENVQRLIHDAVPKLSEFIEKLNDLSSQSTPVILPDQRQLLRSISDNLRLTQTQRSKLMTLTKGFLIRTQKHCPTRPTGCCDGDLSRLERFLKMEVTSKHDSKRVFNELESVLNEDVLGRKAQPNVATRA